MRETISRYVILCFLLGTATPGATASTKPHLLTFGKWLPVQLLAGPAEDAPISIKVRSLSVDGVVKEFTTGEPHEITERLFVVRRAYRLNDNLPGDSKAPVRWVWRRGDWLLVNRASGKIKPLSLPGFHPFYSEVSWYRDYAAYCGVSDSGTTLYALVVQVDGKKPVLRKELGEAHEGELPDSECDAPVWERRPARVTFSPRRYPKLTYTVFGHTADIASDATED